MRRSCQLRCIIVLLLFPLVGLGSDKSVYRVHQPQDLLIAGQPPLIRQISVETLAPEVVFENLPKPVTATLPRPSDRVESPARLPCCRAPRDFCSPRCSGWTAEFGPVVMFRDRPRSSILFNDTQDPTSNINARDFNFDAQLGLEAAIIGHRVFGDRDLELRFMAVDDWSETQQLAMAGGPRINNTPPTFVAGSRDITSLYSSQLYDFEANLRQPAGDVTWLIGFRHLRINEDLQTSFVSTETPPFSTEYYNVGTRNRLYGLQIGVDAILAGNCHSCLRGYVKGGLFGSDASQRSVLVNEVTDPPTVFTRTGSDAELTALVETGVNLTWRLDECSNAYVGYRGMWVDGVALASEQVAATGFSPAAGSLTANDSVFYHGLRFGVQIRF